MFKFTKARPQVLNDLDEYLQLIGDEPVLWLEREIRSWNEFSYEELASLIASGNVELINWQQRYARVVNEKFNPLWLAAIQAGSFASTRGRITIDDSDVRVKEFLRTHGAEFVTQLSDESKRAVANVILFGQSENLKPVDIAKLIRPLIGLNAPQAQANLNYRARVLNKLIESGLSPAQAAIRADKSAATYAVKQHKYRAETIVHTELARAYNQGAFDGVKAAVDAKLMPHCEMIWSTAGTNRVCSRCLELKDTVVGRTDEVGVQIPPLHPRCRCVIIYRESSRPRGVPTIGGNSTAQPQTLTARQRIIRDAEDRAFNTSTGAGFGFKLKNTQAKWRDEVVMVNPTKNAQDIERTMNCQRCVVAHEARMRGFDVIARATWGFEDPLLKVREWLKVFADDDKEIFRCQGNTPAEIEKFIVGKMTTWGANSRAFVWFEWNNATRSSIYGHVIVAQLNENGFVNFGDPQSGEIGAIRCLNEAKLDSVKIMRVDKLNFTDLVKRCCVNRE